MKIRFGRSRLHGTGAFATRPIKKGEVVIEYVGERISELTWSRRPLQRPADPGYTTYSGVKAGGHRLVIDPQQFGNGCDLINHSCAPNCRRKSQVPRQLIVAARAIARGEELTFDYALNTSKPLSAEALRSYACLCGSPRCRKTTLGRGKQTPAPEVLTRSVLVKLQGGFGANVLQILAGYTLAQELAVPCEVLLPDAPQADAKRSYKQRHANAALPSDRDLSAVFWRLRWRGVQRRIKPPADARDLPRYFVDRFLAGENFADPKYAVDDQVATFMGHTFYRSDTPPLALSAVPALHTLFEPDVAVKAYLRALYPTDAIGVHLHAPAPRAFYLSHLRQGDTALFVGGRDATLQRACEKKGVRVLVAEREPSFIDFFILARCKRLLLGQSRLGEAAALVSKRCREVKRPTD